MLRHDNEKIKKLALNLSYKTKKNTTVKPISDINFKT